MIAKEALAHATTATEAAKAAKVLVGSYANLRPADPDTFVTSIAAVLAQYPLGLVRECVDPRVGAARKIKFLSVTELVEWLDERLEHHQVLAQYRPRALPPPAKVYSAEHRGSMIARFLAMMAGRKAHHEDPVDKFRREYRARVEQQHKADKARAVAEAAE